MEKLHKSFTDVLGQTLNSDNAAQPKMKQQVLKLCCKVFLQHLLMALAYPRTNRKTGTDEVGETTDLDPVIVKALQALDEQSDALNQLIDSGAFQQWLIQGKRFVIIHECRCIQLTTCNQELTIFMCKALMDQALPKTAVKLKRS